MNIFAFNNTNNSLQINEYEILLIKEFSDLWKPERNKSKDDPSGSFRKKAFREFTYIYLVLDWKSPYFQYLEQEKHEYAIIDSGLSEEELKDDLFKNAFNKYKEIQDADRILSLIKTAYKTIYKMQIFLDGIDFQNDIDIQTGKPLYKPADVIKDIKSIAQIRNELSSLEIEYKKEQQAQSALRGDITPSYDDI